MFHIHDVVQLKPEERVQAIVRKHVVTLFPSLALSGLLIIIPFFFLFHLLRGGVFGLIVFVVAVAAGLFLALRAMHIWDSDVFVITTERVIDVDQHGLWARMVAEVPLHTIQDVRWERTGIIEAIFQMGSVRLATTVPPSELVAVRVAHPERIQAQLQDLRKQPSHFPKQETNGKAQEDILSQREHIQLLLTQATEKTLTDVEHLLSSRAEQGNHLDHRNDVDHKKGS